MISVAIHPENGPVCNKRKYKSKEFDNNGIRSRSVKVIIAIIMDGVLHLKDKSDSSVKSHGKHKHANAVDFVLAYRRKRRMNTGKEGDDDTELNYDAERQKFYRKLREHGILVNVDDDPTVCICNFI